MSALNNFGEQFKKIQAELTEKPEGTEDMTTLRDKFLSYQRIQQQEQGLSVEIQDITSQIEQAEQFLTGQAAAEDNAEKAESFQQLQELLEQMKGELGRLRTEQQAQEELLQGLMSPAFKNILERAAMAEISSKKNIKQLKELLEKDDGKIWSPARLKLLGKLYGLDPSPANKELLIREIKAMTEKEVKTNPHEQYKGYSEYDVVGEAISEAIEFSDYPPEEIEDLIELIYPPHDYIQEIKKTEKQYAENLESLYAHSRIEAYDKLAEKNIHCAITEGDAEKVKEVITKEIEKAKMQDRRGISFSKYQQSIVNLYLREKNPKGAKEFINSEQISSERFEGMEKIDDYIAIFKLTGDKADLDSAREVKADDHHGLYSEAEKWQKIGEMSGEQEDFDKANQALEEMGEKSGRQYAIESVFNFYKRMHDLPGIDKIKLQEILREEAKAMNHLNRVKAYAIIADMTRQPEDEDILRTEILGDKGELSKYGDRPPFDETSHINDWASYDGYLLKTFLRYMDGDPGRVTLQNREITEHLLEKFEKRYSYADDRSNARDLFWHNIDGAKEWVSSIFRSPKQLMTEIKDSNAETIYQRIWRKINFYNTKGESGLGNLRIMMDTLEHKCKDAKEFNNYFCAFSREFLKNKSKTEQDLRFLQRMVESYRNNKEAIPINDDIIDEMCAHLAKFSTATDEADQHIAQIKDVYEKGLAIAEVAKMRRDFVV